MSHRWWLSCMLPLLALPCAVDATTRLWPGSAPCAGTLQECVNGAVDGDRIEIATVTPIDENIYVSSRSLTLTAADGYAPSFGSQRFMQIYSSPTAGDLTVSVSGLRFVAGGIDATYNGAGVANYELRDLDVGCAACGSLVRNISIGALKGTLNATLYNNRIVGNDAGLLEVYATGATLNANLSYNKLIGIAGGTVSGSGLGVDISGSADGTRGTAGLIKLFANEIRGSYAVGGISITEGLSGAATSTVLARIFNNVVIGRGSTSGIGIDLDVTSGSIDALVVNNSISRCQVGFSAEANSNSTPSGAITGTVVNNLILAQAGLEFSGVPPTAGLSNDYNLLDVATNSPTLTLGSHTITAPAQVVSDSQPRLRAGSPAIDAADNVALGSGIFLNQLPKLDADGLRRFKGASGKADIGAYEYGDRTFTHTTTSNTISGNTSTLDDNALNDNAGAALLATSNFNIGLAGGAIYTHDFGAYYLGSRWQLFNQDFENAMPAGVHFDVFAPAAGSGSFTHVSSAANTDAFFTTISDPNLDDLPDQIVLVAQNWTAGGAGLYNRHVASVFYGTLLALDTSWHIANLDAAAMQQPLGFNVYAQEPSPNAWRVTLSAGNADGYNALRLDHPLLDNTPCARPQVTRLYGGFGRFDLWYYAGKWHIDGSGEIFPGEQFHVLVDPAQVFECTDRVFANAFD